MQKQSSTRIWPRGVPYVLYEGRQHPLYFAKTFREIFELSNTYILQVTC
jgi:hypothetical protein